MSYTNPASGGLIPLERANAYSVGTTAPVNPIQGDLWMDTSTLYLYIYSGGAWVAIEESALEARSAVAGIYKSQTLTVTTTGVLNQVTLNGLSIPANHGIEIFWSTMCSSVNAAIFDMGAGLGLNGTVVNAATQTTQNGYGASANEITDIAQFSQAPPDTGGTTIFTSGQVYIPRRDRRLDSIATSSAGVVYDYKSGWGLASWQHTGGITTFYGTATDQPIRKGQLVGLSADVPVVTITSVTLYIWCYSSAAGASASLQSFSVFDIDES